MKTYLINAFLLLTIAVLLPNCATQRSSTIVGVDYDATKNETEYIVLPYGSVTLPGKWEKSSYNATSKQQFFKNRDSVKIAIAFGRIDMYEFNTDGLVKGNSFVNAYYEWDSKYFVDTHGLQRQVLINDVANNFMIYRIYGQKAKRDFNTYFLMGEDNGNTSNFSISDTDKWTENEKIDFLKDLFLREKEG